MYIFISINVPCIFYHFILVLGPTCVTWQRIDYKLPGNGHDSVETCKGKGKGHPCTGTEALYRPVRPIGGVEV